MATIVWAEDDKNDDRVRSIRVMGVRANEAGDKAGVVINFTISGPGPSGPNTSVAQRNLTPTNARVLAAQLEAAAEYAEQSDYQVISRAANLLATVQDGGLRSILEHERNRLIQLLQAMDDRTI